MRATDSPSPSPPAQCDAPSLPPSKNALGTPDQNTRLRATGGDPQRHAKGGQKGGVGVLACPRTKAITGE